MNLLDTASLIPVFSKCSCGGVSMLTKVVCLVPMGGGGGVLVASSPAGGATVVGVGVAAVAAAVSGAVTVIGLTFFL